MKKRNLKLFSLTLAAAMAFTVLGAGCSKQPEETTAEAPSSTESGTMVSVTTPTPQETAADQLPEGMMYSYLTGLPVTTEVGTRRPLAVMIDNEKKAMPQNGVSSADVVYETPIEANEVRLEMIIQDYSELSRFGGLRSARRYHPGIAYEFDAIFFHHGHSDLALPYLEDTEHCDDIDGVTDRGYPATYEVDDHAKGHRTFSNPEKINTRIEKLGIRTEVRSDFDYKFKFAKESEPNTLPGGTAANKVTIGYKQNQPWFEYDSEDQLYYRYAYGEAHVDQESGQQIAVKNILVQYCDYELEWDKDTKNIYTTGEGSGVFITNGKSEPITWSKEEYWDNTHYFDASGQEIELNPGKTWVCIVLPKMTGEITVE